MRSWAVQHNTQEGQMLRVGRAGGLYEGVGEMMYLYLFSDNLGTMSSSK